MNVNRPAEFIEFAFIHQPLTGEIGLFRHWLHPTEMGYSPRWDNFIFEAMDGQLLPGCAEYWDVCEHDLTPEQLTFPLGRK